MAPMRARRSWRRLARPLLAALAVGTALTAAPLAAAASTGASPATPAALTRAFEAGPDGLGFLAFGPRHEGDGELLQGWWT